MGDRVNVRIVLVAVLVLLVASVAFVLPLAGVLLAAGGCGLAGWFALAPDPDPLPVPLAAAAEPSLAEVAASIDEPLLFVERHRVTHANAAATDLLGHHIVGEDVRLAIRQPAAAAGLSAALADGAAGPPVALTGLGGSDGHWQMTILPLGAGGLLVRLADRTAARAAERMRVDFVANASHELRTPLATLLGFIETLEVANGPRDAATRLRFLKTMMGEARRMQRLIEDLMSLSRIEAEQHSVPHDAVALADVAAEVADGICVAQAIARDRIAIVVEAALPTVTGDRAQLNQLLHNLIGNAIKYGRAGGPVRVTLARAGAMVRLAVADEGEGIAREHLPRLTERFYRIDAGRSRAIGGTGLGLAIVKHIVERHRGRLEIASIVGTGTTVSVRLPVATEAVSSNCNANVTEGATNRTIGDSERA